MSLDLLSINMWPIQGTKNMALRLDSISTGFLLSFLSLLAHPLPCTFPPVEPISSAAQSLLCTPENQVLISPTESDETGFWFFQASMWSSFQIVCGGGSRVTHELLYSMTYWQICNYFMQTEVHSPTSISCGSDPESIT